MENRKMVEFGKDSRQFAQGDICITRVESLPEGVRKATAERDGYVVTHSETGHHHVIADVAGVALYETGDPFVAYLQVSDVGVDGGSVVLRHLRSWDTHTPVSFSPGVYRVNRQQERAGESWVRAQD